MLFPDTFTDFFHPEVGTAAVEVLEGAGYGVELPRRRVCCGRPLYDYGMLDRARRMLDRSLDVLYPAAMARAAARRSSSPPAPRSSATRPASSSPTTGGRSRWRGR